MKSLNFPRTYSDFLLTQKASQAHEESVVSINPYCCKFLHPWIVKAKYSGFIPTWEAFVGLISSFCLNGKATKKWGIFHKG